MPELAIPWLVLSLAGPLLGALATYLSWSERAHRRASVTFALATLAVTFWPLAELLVRGESELRDPWLPLIQLDELSALLLPFAALLFAMACVVRPRSECTPRAVRRSFLAEAVTLALFSTDGPHLLAVLWVVLIALFLWDLRDGAHRRAFALASRYLGLSALLVCGGVLAMAHGARVDERLVDAGAISIALGAMIRKGIFPLHSWVPEVLEHGKLGPAILFSAPQIAAYVVLRVVVPASSPAVLAVVAGLSLFTSVYGAAAFVVQKDARRAFGYLFMSQSALVMVGLESTSVAGIVGGTSLWLSSGIALAGMGATVWMLEARRGRMSIDRLHGGYADKPLLAVSFLVLGLASVGFPCTLGFVAHELLIDGAVTDFPHVGFAVIVAASLCAIGVLRMYFALFCGKGVARVRTKLRRRELAAMLALVLVLLAGGLVPQPVTEVQARVASRVMEHRAEARLPR